MTNVARTVAAVISALVIITSATVAYATPAVGDGKAVRDPDESSLLSYRESGCTEFSYQRGGRASAVRPLVPERFTLTPFSPPADRVYLYVTEVTCDLDQPPASSPTTYTYLIVSTPVTATEGTQRKGAYVLFYVTENRAQLAAFRQLGWPTTPLSHHTTAQITHDTTGVVLGTALNVLGSGWDHELAALATERPGDVQPQTSELYRDTPTGPQTLCFDNQISVTPAMYNADLRNTPLADLAYGPNVFLVTAAFGSLVHGGWDATVTTQTCPT